MSRRDAPRVDFNTAFGKLRNVVKDVYQQYGLQLPDTVYYADSAAEEDYGINRHYGGTSDFDIILPEPSGPNVNVNEIENIIRARLGESGFDFNFEQLSKLQKRDAYGRICIATRVRW